MMISRRSRVNTLLLITLLLLALARLDTVQCWQANLGRFAVQNVNKYRPLLHATTGSSSNSDPADQVTVSSKDKALAALSKANNNNNEIAATDSGSKQEKKIKTTKGKQAKAVIKTTIKNKKSKKSGARKSAIKAISKANSKNSKKSSKPKGSSKITNATTQKVSNKKSKRISKIKGGSKTTNASTEKVTNDTQVKNIDMNKSTASQTAVTSKNNSRAGKTSKNNRQVEHRKDILGLSSWEEFLGVGSASIASSTSGIYSSSSNIQSSTNSRKQQNGNTTATLRLPSMQDLFPVKDTASRNETRARTDTSTSYSSPLDDALPVEDLFYSSPLTLKSGILSPTSDQGNETQLTPVLGSEHIIRKPQVTSSSSPSIKKDYKVYATAADKRQNSDASAVSDKVQNNTQLEATVNNINSGNNNGNGKNVRKKAHKIVGGVMINPDPPKRAVNIHYNPSHHSKWASVITLNTQKLGPIMSHRSAKNVPQRELGLFCEYFTQAAIKWDICPPDLRRIVDEYDPSSEEEEEQDTITDFDSDIDTVGPDGAGEFFRRVTNLSNMNEVRKLDLDRGFLFNTTYCRRTIAAQDGDFHGERFNLEIKFSFTLRYFRRDSDFKDYIAGKMAMVTKSYFSKVSDYVTMDIHTETHDDWGQFTVTMNVLPEQLQHLETPAYLYKQLQELNYVVYLDDDNARNFNEVDIETIFGDGDDDDEDGDDDEEDDDDNEVVGEGYFQDDDEDEDDVRDMTTDDDNDYDADADVDSSNVDTDNSNSKSLQEHFTAANAALYKSGQRGVFFNYSASNAHNAPFGGRLGKKLLKAVEERAAERQPRVIAIGDVHGCIEELKTLLRHCEYRPGDLIVFLGDLVCKGPDSASVVQLAREMGAIGVRGNHDFEVIRWASAIRSGRVSVEGTKANGGSIKSEHYKVASRLSRADVKWMQNMPWYINSNELSALFVHAGLVSGMKLSKQNPRLMINMRSILPDGTVTSKFFKNWPWARLWDGPMTVLFGHDADRGLQQYKKAIGLDTGCVYGGRLTACILPKRELVSVQANQEYTKYKRKLYD